MGTQDIVQKLWNLCNVLRDDGITYHQYVTELTYLLFLKMAKETETEEQLPKGYRWDDLETKDGVEQLNFYRGSCSISASKGSARVQAIFANASTSLKVPRNLKKLVDAIDALDWYGARTKGSATCTRASSRRTPRRRRPAPASTSRRARSSTRWSPW